MDNKKSEKRSIIIDSILLTAIFSIFLLIIFITFVDNQTEKKQTIDHHSNSVAYSMPKSETSETSSPYSNIRIVTDVSNDSYIPFAIQYPVTTYTPINEQILAVVDREKQNYIKEMQSLHVKNGKELAGGELNISFEMFKYDEDYYSFLLQIKRSIPNKKQTHSYHTFVMENKTGDIIDINTLLNFNEESLNILSTQVQALMLDEAKFSHIKQSHLEKQTSPNWGNFEHFIIYEDQLHFYFNNLVEDQSNKPLSISLNLSMINPLLSEEFQIQMVDETDTTPLQTEKKLVALTFDDGPHPDVTPLIVSLLEKYNAKATFFMLGNRVQYYPEIARQVYESGHEVGNHTWNHPVLTKLTEAQILQEYSMTEQAIIQAIGAPSTIFRPPYGATNDLVKSVIPSPQFNWTVDTEDWKHRSANKLLPIVQQAIHPNAVILMHDIHLSTAHGLEAVLQYLQREGYEFVTLSQIMSQK